MTERNPDEVAGMQGLIAAFYRSIEQAGVDGEMAIDALEFAIWNLLVDSIDRREASINTWTKCGSDVCAYGT